MLFVKLFHRDVSVFEMYDYHMLYTISLTIVIINETATVWLDWICTVV